jgi:adenylate kinase family enzyme
MNRCSFSETITDLARVHFVGASGAGTTTLGRAFALRQNLSHFETDAYLWEPTEPPYQRLRPKDARVHLLRADLEAISGWVLSGSLANWGDALIPHFQLVVLVRVPTELRIARLRERELRRFGPGALAPGGVMHRSHIELIDWASRYDDGDQSIRSRRLHDAWLSSLPCRTLQIDGSGPVEALVDELLLRLRSPTELRQRRALVT